MRLSAHCGRKFRRAGALATELVVAVGVLTSAVIPFAFGYLHEQRLIRHAYHHAIAMELVDGEAERLAAGALGGFPEGQSVYTVTGPAADSLPPGRFLLARRGNSGALEWQPERAVHGGQVRREFRLQTTKPEPSR